MDCNVILKSNAGGENQCVKSSGNIEEKNGVYTVDYKIDGDDCKMIISQTEVFQQRSGDMCLSMHFIVGKYTYAQFSSQGFSGGYKVLCEEIKVVNKRGRLGLTLTFLSGDDAERITINFGAITAHRQELK